MLSKIWFWDPGSGKKPIPDPGFRGHKGTGSRFRIHNTAYLLLEDQIGKFNNLLLCTSFRVCKLWNAVIARPGYLASKKKYFQYRYHPLLIFLIIPPSPLSFGGTFFPLQRQVETTVFGFRPWTN
jgi:hypothetical protein